MKSNPVRPKDRFLVFGSPLIEEEIQEVADCLRSGWLGTGPKVTCFENDFRSYYGGNHAVAVNSCTALNLLAAGLEPGDEVITSALTFGASVNAIIHADAKPILAEVDPITMNLDPLEVQKKISSLTHVLLPVAYMIWGLCP